MPDPIRVIAPLAPYLAKLERRLALPADDREALLALPATVQHFEAQKTIVHEGDVSDQSLFLIKGLISQQRIADGVGQIVSISVPGDGVDLQNLFFYNTDHALFAHAPTTVACVPHAALIQLCERRPHLAKVLWHDTLVDSAIFREWATNIGHRRAPDRIGFFLLELEARLHAVGQMDDGAFEMPLTQQELASALGLSLVHMNKSLRRLREANRIETQGRNFRIVDREGLKQAVAFDDAYLHLCEPPAVEKHARSQAPHFPSSVSVAE